MVPVRQNPIQRTVRLFICVCTALCTIVAHNIAQNRPDSFPPYPPDNHHCSDDVLFEGRGEETFTACIIAATIMAQDISGKNLQWPPQLRNNEKMNKWSKQFHITATHGRFKRIHQVAPMCTPSNTFPLAQPSPHPKRHLDWFSRLRMAHGRVPILCNGPPLSPQNCPSYGEIWTPSNTWFPGPTQVTSQMAS